MDKSFRIERPSTSKTIKMKDTVNIEAEDNINLRKNNEDIHLSQVDKSTQSSSHKPQLTRDYTDIQKDKPKLVPMDGLDLLSNPKKTYNDLSGTDSYHNDSDEDRHSYSSSSDSVRNDFSRNLYSQPRFPTSDFKDSDSDRSSRRSSRSSRSSRSNRSRHYDSSSSVSEFERPKTYEDIQREKQFLLFKLDRLEKSMKIKLPRRFTMASQIEDIKYEYEKLKRQRDVDRSIKFQRKILMAVTSGTEYLNNKFDPIDAKLDGWSESVMENIEDYDEVFEELHDKYSEKIEVAPELKLLMMVGGSAFMFHLTNTLFKSNVPSLNEILKQNPDIMRNISQAAVNQMNTNMGGGGNDPFSNMMREGVNMKANQYEQRYQEQQNSRGRMNGPDGVDDILNQLGSRGKQGGNYDSPSDTDQSVKHFATNRKRRVARNNKQRGINIDV